MGWEQKGGNFLQAKISSYMYVVYYFAYWVLNCECFVGKIVLESWPMRKLNARKHNHVHNLLMVMRIVCPKLI